MNGAYYCDVLLLKQLMPYICQAAGDFFFPAHHVCTRALNCCDTKLRTSHQTWPPNRPDLYSVDYRLLSHSGKRLSETARDVRHRRWAAVINVETPWAIMLQIYFWIRVPKIIKIQRSLTKLLQKNMHAVFCPTVFRFFHCFILPLLKLRLNTLW